jgi:hypothetical protein
MNFVIGGGLLSLAALVLWLAARSRARERARHDAVDLRVRTLAQAHLESGSIFGYGAASALLGNEAWSNPHCTPTGDKSRSQAWAAGWCYGRQQLDDAWRDED